MKVLMLTQWFDPEPTVKGLLFARALRDRGHEVEVVTGFPNYPEGDLYPGFRMRLAQRQDIDGISVLRVALYPSHDASATRRAANYLSFSLSAAVFGSAMTNRPDVIYVYHPPLTVSIAGWILSKVKRAPFVLDVQDLWPDTLAATGMIRSRPLLHAIGRVCRWVYSRASGLAVLSPGFKDVLVDRGVPADKIDVISNWSHGEEEELADDQGSGAPSADEHAFTVVFAGTMGKAQGLETVLDAAAILRRNAPAVGFALVGGGVEVAALKRKAEEMALDNVRFLPRVPFSEIGKILADADALLVHLRADPLFEITIPSKTQAYLALGKPILMAVSGDAARVVEDSGGGVVCRPEDAEDMARAVRELAEMPRDALNAMGARGRAYYLDNLALDVGAERFIQLFEKACRG